ncbi:stage III sporulation protein AF [Ectobacillus antri]|uniref:Stage III sporulation protein AF n=1 Tax=Ectobacillus antri TaxID=2486280 RepID=A0ABT6H3I9_9BACI|nr:stage III sporulation protein AF [Ectobacillus antri]MDG4655595.1 stage III sporulation protein AF [Ectobacillus antri]MDG5753353.1 stage III sporulation protein AF [Ectobacillus antri]
MAYITEWIRTIIVFLLLATVLHMLLPNTSLQKYVKFVVSLLLIVLILTPVFKLLRTDVQEVIAGFNTSASKKNIENVIDQKKKEIQASQRAYILEQMAVQMKKQVAKDLEVEYGVQVVDLRITAVSEVKSPEDIQEISVTFKEADRKTSGTVEAVKRIKIDTSTPHQQTVDKQATQDIQQFLAREWQLEESKIMVQEGGRGHERQ